MLGMLALMAVTLVGADEGSCARHVNEAAIEEMLASVEAGLYEAEAYADAESDFGEVLAEAGLAGSTLGREELRAAAGDAFASAIARNR